MGERNNNLWLLIVIVIAIVIVFVAFMILATVTSDQHCHADPTPCKECECDDDCSGTKPICNTETDKCVQCKCNANCPTNHRCQNSICVPLPIPQTCQSSQDCPSGLICDYSECCTPISPATNITFELNRYTTDTSSLPGISELIYTGVLLNVRWQGATNSTLQVSDDVGFGVVRSSHHSTTGLAAVPVPLGEIMYFRVVSQGCGGSQTSSVASYRHELPENETRCYVSYYSQQVQYTGELFYNGPSNNFSVETPAYCLTQYAGVGCALNIFPGNQLGPLADQTHAVTGGDFLTGEIRTVPVPSNQRIMFIQPASTWYTGEYGGYMVLKDDYLASDPRYYTYNGNLWSRLGTDLSAWPTLAERTAVYFGPFA